MRWLRAGATVAATSMSAAASAQGTPPNVDVAWSAPPECPARAAVLGEVRSILEGSTVAAHRVDARAAVTRAGYTNALAAKLTRDALLQNCQIAEGDGFLPISVFCFPHFSVCPRIPRALCPELDNVIANLE